MIKSYTFTGNKSKLRLDKYLANKLPDYSRSKIQFYIKLGQVKVNGEPVKSSMMLQGEEIIVCHFKKELLPEELITGETMDLDILYEDSELAVINKPAGLVVHPGNGNRTGTLLNGLVDHFKKISHADSHRPGIVHRLDKYTSGVIIIAKNDNVHDALGNQFIMRQVKKEYLALVWGKLDDKGVISGNIARHPKNRQLFTTTDNHGRESFTEYKLVEYYPPLSFIKLYPKTGRTHQLRVHLKSIGHPIFCDDAYGGSGKHVRSFHVRYTQIINRILKILNRVALHAHTIKIYHPCKEENIEFIAPLPKDIQLALTILKNEY